MKTQVLIKDRQGLGFIPKTTLAPFSLIISNCLVSTVAYFSVIFYLLLIANTIYFSLVYTKIQLKISCNVQYLRTMQLGLVSSMSSFYRLSDLYYHLNALMLPFLFVCWTNWQLQKIYKVGYMICSCIIRCFLLNIIFSLRYNR